MVDVTKEFREGMDAAADAPCPYYATSDCAAAWWLGRNARELRFNASMQCGRVTTGRGGRLNLLVGRAGKSVFHVDWNANPDCPPVTYA